MDAVNESGTRRFAGRAWFRYSLRAMLTAIVLLAVALGVWVSRADTQRRAVAALEEAGARVRYDFELATAGKQELSPLKSWIQRQLGVDLVANAAVVFFLPDTSDSDLAKLAGLRHLKKAYIQCPQVTDNGLVYLSPLASLEELHLNGAHVTDAGLVHLGSLKRLTWLSLPGTAITDEGLEHLRGMKNLQVLNLYDTQVSDKGLRRLSEHSKLRWLILTRTQVTNRGCRAFLRSAPGCRVNR